MKRTLLTIAGTMIISGSALCAQDNGLYIGLGYANTNVKVNVDNISDSFNELLDTATDSVVFLAGYDFNEYLGVEGRYYLNASEIGYEYYVGNTPLSGKYKAESFAIYAKPQYTLSMLNLYALLGVTSNDYTLDSLLGGNKSDTLFSWGAGVKVNITQSLGAFIDYTNFGESENLITNTDLSSWNIGFSYKF